jgi:hypothetical protein
MVSLGNATLSTIPPPTIFSDQFFINVDTDLGIYIGAADRCFNLDPKPIPTAPILGQIWPRGVVGPYIGVGSGSIVPGTLGFAFIHNFSQDLAPANAIYGQLWPRGDYIPSEND